ncbi:unnamed protein product [Urochloa humidicola]
MAYVHSTAIRGPEGVCRAVGLRCATQPLLEATRISGHAGRRTSLGWEEHRVLGVRFSTGAGGHRSFFRRKQTSASVLSTRETNACKLFDEIPLLIVAPR